MNSKYDENEIKNYSILLMQNTNDYAWFKFKKCCGYSIMFPFVLDDNIQALYHHIDVLWKNNTINIIWFEKNDNDKNINEDGKMVITRGDQRTIRQFIYDNNLYRHNFGIIYNVYFDTVGHHNYLNSHIHNNNCKNIN